MTVITPRSETEARPTTTGQSDQLAMLIDDWRTHLTAANRSKLTVKTYLRSCYEMRAYFMARGMPLQVASITSEHVETFIAHRLSIVSDTTARKDYDGIKQFFAYLIRDGEIRAEGNPMLTMEPPQINRKVTPVLTDAELAALMATCAGNDFLDRRDNALMRVLADCGVRSDELRKMTIDDVNFDEQMILVHGKGGKDRLVPFGMKTSEALRRYRRARLQQPYGHLAALWITNRGALSEPGLQNMLDRRAAQAGVKHVHPHKFRHTFAHRWMSEDDGHSGELMELAGWDSPQMLERYGRAARNQRARARHRRMALGDRF